MTTTYKYILLLSTVSLISASTGEKAPSKHSEGTPLSEKISEGKELASQSCTKCHDSSVYTKKDRKIKTLSSLTARVKKCNVNTGAGLDEEELADLTLFLNTSYYKFQK